MKKSLRKIFTTFLFLILSACVNSVLADEPPPPPPGGGDNGGKGLNGNQGVPLGEGVLVLTLLSIGYGAMQYRLLRKNLTSNEKK